MNFTTLNTLSSSAAMYWDHASNRTRLSPDLCVNHQYFPDGILLFDTGSLRIWSFASEDDAIAFLNTHLQKPF